MNTKKPGGAGPEVTPPQDTQPQSPAKKPASKKKAPGRKGKQTPPEVQAQIIAALLSGQFAEDQDVALEVGVSRATVSRMKKAIPAVYLKTVENDKKDEIGGLVVEFLTGALESLKRIDNVTLHESWLLKQGAAELATLYGVKADKVIKILDAIERANRPEGEDDSEGIG